MSRQCPYEGKQAGNVLASSFATYFCNEVIAHLDLYSPVGNATARLQVEWRELHDFQEGL